MPYTEAAKHRAEGRSNSHVQQRSPRERGKNTGLHYSFLKGRIVLGGRHCCCCCFHPCACALAPLPSMPAFSLLSCNCRHCPSPHARQPIEHCLSAMACRAGLEEHPGFPGPHPRPCRCVPHASTPFPHPSTTCNFSSCHITALHVVSVHAMAASGSPQLHPRTCRKLL
jgi:hypothetical protein